MGLRKIFIWPALLISAAAIPPIAITRSWLLYLSLSVFGLSLGFAVPLIKSMVGELDRIGPALIGKAFGLIFMFNRIGCFLVPWFLGYIMTKTNRIDFGLFLIALIMLISPVLILFVKETGKGRAKVQLKPMTA